MKHKEISKSKQLNDFFTKTQKDEFEKHQQELRKKVSEMDFILNKKVQGGTQSNSGVKNLAKAIWNNQGNLNLGW